MLRTILAVVGGYVAMVVVVFGTFTGLFLALGTERVFQPGTFDPSGIWLFSTLGVAIAAAIIGGFVARRLGSSGGVKGLAALVLVLGFVSAWPALTGTDDRPNVRTGEVSNMEAAANARQPVWVALALPFIGVAGVLIGGRASRR
jgi:hypothetical protein